MTLRSQVCSTCIAIFLFLMNLVGGNLPVIVSPLRSYFNDYRCSPIHICITILTTSLRSALYLVWPGFLAISAIFFLLASLPLWLRDKRQSKQYEVNK